MTEFKITNFDAVAFDLEGTLADTIPTHHRTRIAAFEHHGFGHITREQHELGSVYGSSHTAITGGILHQAGEVVDNESLPFDQNQTVLDVIATKGELFRSAAANGFDAMPGAIAFVQAIAAHFVGKMAIVTSAEEEFAFAFVERYALGQYFSPALTIGHESVIAEGLAVKPSGDPYLLAMRRLPSKKLLVFEDTISGVASAKKAGATVIALGFEQENTLLFQKGGLEYPPDAVVYSYEEAAALLDL